MKLKFWQKETLSESKLGHKEKEFVLSAQMERDLLPLISLQQQMQSKMLYLRTHDKAIKDMQKAIDNADKVLSSKEIKDSDDYELIDELLTKKQSTEQKIVYLMLADKEVNDLDVKMKEMMLDKGFYSPLLKHCWEITDDEIEKKEAHEIEDMIAFFLTNIRPKKRSSMNFSQS